MYAIVSEGKLISLCERPRYIKVNPASGAYVEAEPEEACGIAIGGEPYNLPGGTEIPGRPEALVSTGDIGEYVFRNAARIEENEAQSGTAFVELEAAVCELDAATDTRLTDIEAALCELDGAING